MPECERYEEMISAYLDNELSPEEANELTAHLQSCPACAALMNTYSLLFAKTAPSAVPAGFTASVMGMTNTVKAPQRARKRAPIIRFFAAAAACLLLVGAAYPMVSTMLASKGTDTAAESTAQETSVAFSMTTGAATTMLESAAADADDMAAMNEMDDGMAENTKASAKEPAGEAVADTSLVSDSAPTNGAGTALLIIDGTVPAEETEKRGSNAVYVYGELPENCQNLDFGEIAESNGTAFIAPIDKALADELIRSGHEHDSGEILYLIWYPN